MNAEKTYDTKTPNDIMFITCIVMHRLRQEAECTVECMRVCVCACVFVCAKYTRFFSVAMKSNWSTNTTAFCKKMYRTMNKHTQVVCTIYICNHGCMSVDFCFYLYILFQSRNHKFRFHFTNQRNGTVMHSTIVLSHIVRVSFITWISPLAHISII